jgi:predicted ATPase
MEGFAAPGTTYVTGETFKLTEGFFRFEALGEKEAKGKKEPVKVYRVIAPSTRRTRFDVNAEHGLTPLVGRERELELLLDGFYRAKAGMGQALSIVAEAGIGKSRLLYEFRKAVANEDITFLEGKCLSYSREVAYHPMVDLLKGLFDIHDEESGVQIRAKVTKGLEILGPDEGGALPYLLELLSVKDSGLDEIRMSPEAKRYRLLDALRRIVLKGAEVRPLVMAIEDLHWMDKSSEEVIKDYLDHISASPILLIFTYRTGLIPPWGGKSYHSQITVNRLTNRESILMLTHLLGTERVTSELQEFILTKTEGVPFFIEEFIKSLGDLQLIVRKDDAYDLSPKAQSISIPSTIHDVVTARVDALPENARQLLQTGSAIEREFGYPLLTRVSGLTEQELLSCLSVLKDRELLYERGIYPQSTLLFKHALTREVIYESLLESKRKPLHERIGKGMEELCRDNPVDQCETLAYHFFMGEDYTKAASYSRLAARKAEKTTSLFKAISYAKQRIACLEKLATTEEIKKKIIDARTILGLYYVQMGDHIESKRAIDPIIADAIDLDYRKRLCQIYTIVASSELMVNGNIQDALKTFESALKLAEEVQDVVTLRGDF